MKSRYLKERRKKKYTTLLYLLKHSNFTLPEAWQQLSEMVTVMRENKRKMLAMLFLNQLLLNQGTRNI